MIFYNVYNAFFIIFCNIILYNYFFNFENIFLVLQRGKIKITGKPKTQFEKWISNFSLMDKIVAFHVGRKEPMLTF